MLLRQHHHSWHPCPEPGCQVHRTRVGTWW